MKPILLTASISCSFAGGLLLGLALGGMEFSVSFSNKSDQAKWHFNNFFGIIKQRKIDDIYESKLEKTAAINLECEKMQHKTNYEGDYFIEGKNVYRFKDGRSLGRDCELKKIGRLGKQIILKGGKEYLWRESLLKLGGKPIANDREPHLCLYEREQGDEEITKKCYAPI